MPETATPAAPMGAPIETVTHTPSASTTHEVDITKPSAAISAVEKLGLAKPKGQIMGPKEALGKAATPRETIKDDLKRLRERHTPKHQVARADAPKPAEAKAGKLAGRDRDENGKLLPKTDTPAESEKPTEKPSDKPTIIQGSEKKEEPAQKVKIGDKEMTPDEIAAELKTLREKAESAAKPAETKPAESKPDEAAIAEQKKQLQEARQNFVAETVKAFGVDEKSFDEMLVGGPKGTAAFNAFIGKIIEQIGLSREHLIEQVSRALEDRDKDLKPVLDQQREIQNYRTEADFLEKNPELKATPQAIQESRKVRAEMHNYYDQIQQKIAQGTATAEERLHAERYEKATPKEFDESVAEYTRQRLGIKAGAPPVEQPKPIAQPARTEAAPAKPQPRPPTGQAPAGTAAPARLSTQQEHIQRMRQAGV